MTQFFNSKSEYQKYLIDNPEEVLMDAGFQEVSFDGEKFTQRYLSLRDPDLNTLKPKKLWPERPTLSNLAAIQNWDWFSIYIPDPDTDGHPYTKESRWESIPGGHGHKYSDLAMAHLQVALFQEWQIVFGIREGGDK